MNELIGVGLVWERWCKQSFPYRRRKSRYTEGSVGCLSRRAYLETELDLELEWVAG